MEVGAVIVAAGISDRMKDLKQMIKMGELSTVERIVLNFKRIGIKEIVVVTGYQGKVLEKSLQQYAITFLRNEAYETTEMLDSAKIGLKYLQKQCDQILFCPSDVPFFTEDTVEKLLNADGKLVVPVCNGNMGHPIRVDCDLVEDILSYTGNEGLEGALEKLNVKVVRLQIEDVGAITDTDEQDDYQNLMEKHNSGLMRPEIKVQLVGKKPFWGSTTVKLLKLIDHLESVKAACAKAGISYSKGWSTIHAVENELGYKIVERQQGGKYGGKAYITPEGKQWISLFELYEQRVNTAANELYEEIFSNSGLL